jgi:hypothetical protein
MLSARTNDSSIEGYFTSTVDGCPVDSSAAERDAVVPQLDVRLGYDLTPRIRTTFGYTILWWTGIADAIQIRRSAGIRFHKRLFKDEQVGCQPSFTNKVTV